MSFLSLEVIVLFNNYAQMLFLNVSKPTMAVKWTLSMIYLARYSNAVK